jgi:hypothetical protein
MKHGIQMDIKNEFGIAYYICPEADGECGANTVASLDLDRVKARWDANYDDWQATLYKRGEVCQDGRRITMQGSTLPMKAVHINHALAAIRDLDLKAGTKSSTTSSSSSGKAALPVFSATSTPTQPSPPDTAAANTSTVAEPQAGSPATTTGSKRASGTAQAGAAKKQRTGT